ncbi:MAG: hypothetical protein JSW21_01645 [Gammaproteobacteria bacterium]|nr:MAG: hypothetical protein JSW21_01645 [Gammaproteobacteria bacterium]
MDSVDRERYTLDGPPGAEHRIANDQAIIGAAVRDAVSSTHLVALVLAGGYGRGEGGYRLNGDAFLPYNDYDYFVIVRGGRSAARQATATLSELAHRLEAQIGVEVDFAVLRQSRLRRLDFTLMYAELRHGHKVVMGDPDVLARMPSMPVEDVPLSEFSRLMLNRGSLLLMNRQVLQQGGPRDDQALECFGRYLDKALLACADARLAAAGRYHPSYMIKRQRLDSLRWSGSRDFMTRYDKALRSRAGQVSCGALVGREADAQAVAVADWLEALVELETARLGKLPEWKEYSSARIGKGQSAAGPMGLLRNLAVTMRDFGPAELVRNISWALRYPRERLISVLPALLEPTIDVPNGVLADALAQPGGAGRAALNDQFLRFWARYN